MTNEEEKTGAIGKSTSIEITEYFKFAETTRGLFLPTIEITEYFKFAETHTTDVELTETEFQLLTHTLGYYLCGYVAVIDAEWRNMFDNGSNDRIHYTKALDHLSELGLMERQTRREYGHTRNVYSATEKGKEVARIKYVEYVKAERKKTTAAKRRWTAFCYANDSGYFRDFGEWIRTAPMHQEEWTKSRLRFGF